MDEDGRPAHTWMGTNPYTGPSLHTDPYDLGTLNTTTAADLRSAHKSLLTDYFSAMRSGVTAAFVGAGVAAPLYTGPDTLGTWTSTPPAEVLQAASGIVDILSFGEAYGHLYTQTQENYIAANYGGPITLSTYFQANYDSPYAHGANLDVNLRHRSYVGRRLFQP